MGRPWMEFSAVDASENVEAHVAYLERMAERVRPLRAAAISRLGIGPGSVVLDAGCGLGEFAIELAQLVAPDGRVAGIDASRQMIDRARAAADANAADVDFRLGSITDLPFPAATFDIARSERVFQHLDAAQREAAARELLRVVKPGGVVEVMDPNHRQWAVAANDRELARLVTEFVGARGKTPEAGLLNGALLRAAGGERIEVTVGTVEYDSVSAWFEGLGLEGWIEGLIATQTVNVQRAVAFFDDLRARERDGVFKAVGVVYVATGRRPS